MGHRKVPIIYTLTGFKNDEELVVRMKAIRIGKLRKLVRLIDDEGQTSEDGLDEMFELLLEGLVSWNLDDEEGRPLPTTQDGIDELELPMVLEIMERWLKEMTSVDDDLGKDSPSGASFPGRPLTMEAL